MASASSSRYEEQEEYPQLNGEDMFKHTSPVLSTCKKVRVFGIFGAITLKIVSLIVFKHAFNNYTAVSNFIIYKQIFLTKQIFNIQRCIR